MARRDREEQGGVFVRDTIHGGHVVARGLIKFEAWRATWKGEERVADNESGRNGVGASADIRGHGR